MRKINIWQFDSRVSIKIEETLLKKLKETIFSRYKTKRKFYESLKGKTGFSFKTFSGILKEGYQKRFFIPLKLWIEICESIGINRHELQENIVAYKTSNGPNHIYNPILPVKITPAFDMIIAHNIADGTVIDPKKGRLPYFGYRQFDNLFRRLYIAKLESVFGAIYFPSEYYLATTRPYCPPVLASLFFKVYGLNTRSFLSKTARIPKEILKKNREHLLAVLIAFVIDEGWVDSTMVGIALKNIGLARDIFRICKKLGYRTTFSSRGEYGTVSILRSGMEEFFEDYKKLVKKYPEMTLGKIETKIESGFRIYNRPIYKTKGNKELILRMLQREDLTVNQIALRMSMTRQGVRAHIKNLEKDNSITKIGRIGERNIVYGIKR